MKKTFLLYLTLLLLGSGELWAKSALQEQPVIKLTKTSVVTTGGAVTFPVVVALIALVSSLFSVYLSFRLKDKEYKNDYFKKVIDKRIKAVEGAEKLLGLFSIVIAINNPPGLVYKYLGDFPIAKEDDKFREYLHEFAPSSIWLSVRTEKLLQIFIERIVRVRAAAEKIASADAMGSHFMDAFDDLQRMKSGIHDSLSNDMATLYDVKSFFKSREESKNNLV